MVVTVQDTTDALNSVPGDDSIRLLLIHWHSQNLPLPVGLSKVSFSCSLPLHLLKWLGRDKKYLLCGGFYEYVGNGSSLRFPFPPWQDICPWAKFYVKCKDKHLHRNLPNFLKNCLIWDAKFLSKSDFPACKENKGKHLALNKLHAQWTNWLSSARITQQ